MTDDRLAESQWEPIDDLRFEQLWRVEVEEAQASLEVQTIHLATGLLLPVWNKLPGGSMRVWRVTDRDGGSFLGRIIAPRAVDGLARALGQSIRVELDPEQVVAAAQTRDGIAPAELEGAKLQLALVNGSNRIEVRDFPSHRLALWKSLGCFTEIIAFKTRLFIPTDRAAEIIGIMLGGSTLDLAA